MNVRPHTTPRRRTRARASLKGLRVLITAGPTVEDIDPVRFISNRSSGRMGVALARAAARRGAQVHLVHGPLQVPVPRGARLRAVAVRSAREMHDAVMRLAARADVAVLCAAVADFAPVRAARSKLRKEGRPRVTLRLERTPDILASLGRRRKRPLLVGFAAETENVERNALAKLLRKNCDLVCANLVGVKGSGFGSRTNRVTICRRDGSLTRLPTMTKERAAGRILDEVAAALVAGAQRA